MPVSILSLTAQLGKAENGDGGAIWAAGDLDLTNVAVFSSTTDSDGGGVASVGALRLVDTRIISNTAVEWGGGADLERGGALIGTLIQDNRCDGCGTYGGGGVWSWADLSLRSARFVGNTTGDPRSVNPAAGDDHLTPLSAARDAGANAGVAVDFDGDSRPIGGGFDIGYDESRARLAWVPSVMR